VKRNRAFTIIELMLTMVIISVGMLGIMTLFENASRGALQADLNGVALGLVREKLEWVVVDKVRDGYAWVDNSKYSTESFSGDYSVYSRTTNIYEVSSSDLATSEVGSGYKRVDVTVSWGTGPSNRLMLSTLLSSY
jgi:prepilin-type N-terminal cleavage/methylation domain-containing protein